MRNRIRLFVGYFGILTPVFMIGMITGFIIMGYIDGQVIIPLMVVSAINFLGGYKVLKSKPLGKVTDGKRSKGATISR